MDRLHTHFSYENQIKSDLFKQLFLFQVQLEDYNDERFYHQESVGKIIHEIDQLMELLITDVEFIKLE